jgi:hypothetical protein
MQPFTCWWLIPRTRRCKFTITREQEKEIDRTNQSRLTRQKWDKKSTCLMGNSVSLWLASYNRHHTADVVDRWILNFKEIYIYTLRKCNEKIKKGL